MTRNLPALPSAITPQSIREAALPIRVLAMEKAIAVCTDPYLLKPYSDVLAAMATAARMLKKEIPEQYAALNVIAHNSQLRLGELLGEYSSRVSKSGRSGFVKSERRKIANDLGIGLAEAASLVRLSCAPEKIKEEFRASSGLNANTFVDENRDKVPPLFKEISERKAYSPAFSAIISGCKQDGLVVVRRSLKAVDISNVMALTPDEKSLVSGILTECEKEIERIRSALDKSSVKQSSRA